MINNEKLQELMNKLNDLAKKNNVLLTDKAENIARVRIRLNIPLDKCPCSYDNTTRGCISEKCLQEINENGICHCCCFKRK